MSVVKGIKFKYLAGQLTQVEMRRFINTLLNIDEDIIVKALFSAIIDVNNTVNADNMNNLMSNIIQSRKKKPTHIPKQNMKLDNIPKQLIGAISSFLYQKDYINFSKSNRFIFIGCNTPNLLQILNITKIKNLSSINLSLYPSIKCLAFDINKLNELNGLSTLNQLRYMQLDGKNKTYFPYDIDVLMNDMNTQNITQLTCINFGNSQNNSFFNASQFIKLLSKFANMEYLLLLYTACRFDTNEIKTLYPNLKGLEFSCTHRNKQLITSFANDMKYLSFRSPQAKTTDYNLDTFNFCNLEELKLIRPTTKSINDILKTALNLKKICIETTIRNKCLMKSNETRKLTTNLLKSCKLLEYIEFIDKGNVIHEALNGIEHGLFQTRDLKRKKLKIRIHLKCKHISKSILTIAKIISWLILSEINEFMLILYTPMCLNNKYVVKYDSMIQNLNNNISSNELTKIQIIPYKLFANKQIVITNIDCKINGYSETCSYIGHQFDNVVLKKSVS